MVRPSSSVLVILVASAWLDVVPSCQRRDPPGTSDPLARKTAEAVTELDAIHGATADYFQAQRQCPNDGKLRGESGLTPPLSIDCNEGSVETCQGLWEQNPIWKAMGYSQAGPHYFHYNFIWANNPQGHACQFTIQAFADLDDDGVYSTYERYGAGDVEGVKAADGIYIVNELE